MKSVKFTQDFSSPVLGEVWEGRIAQLKREAADKYITAGVAVEYDPKKEFEKEREKWRAPADESQDKEQGEPGAENGTAAQENEATRTEGEAGKEESGDSDESQGEEAENPPRRKRRYTRRKPLGA